MNFKNFGKYVANVGLFNALWTVGLEVIVCSDFHFTNDGAFIVESYV